MKKWLKQLIYIGFRGTEQIEIIQGYLDSEYTVKGVENMENLQELKIKEKELWEQINKFNKIQYKVYEEFLEKNGLDKEVEFYVWTRNKKEWKKGKILIRSNGYSFIAPYQYEFHSYTKQGKLSINQLGYIKSPENITNYIEEGELRGVEDDE